MTASALSAGNPLALSHVETWLFDLDNTLYPASCNLFAQVDRRIGAFIAEKFGIGAAEARIMQKRFFREHGTTLRGLMTEHGTEPHAFLDYVHAIEYAPVRNVVGHTGLLTDNGKNLLRLKYENIKARVRTLVAAKPPAKKKGDAKKNAHRKK